MKKNNLLLLTVLFAAVLQACHGTTKFGNTDSTSSVNKPSDSSQVATADTAKIRSGSADIKFADKALIGGMTEVGLGKLALMRTSNQKIRDFAHMMVADHGKANTELIEIAKKEKITLPANLDAGHQRKADSLDKMSGTDFDQAYIDAMIDGHKKALSLMQNEATNGKDTSLRAFAAKTAPVVQRHLQAIDKIHSEIKK